MKQKIVVRVPAMHDDDKCRTKALQAVVVSSGVESATVEGAEMVVIGQRINTSKLIRRLEKKQLGEVELLIDGVAGEEPPEGLTMVRPSDQPSCCKPCTIM